MWFLGIGILLIVLKLSEIPPVAGWSWLWICVPFALAVAWWGWADSSGYTKRKEMDKMEAKKADRRRKTMENLGLDERGRRHSRDKR